MFFSRRAGNKLFDTGDIDAVDFTKVNLTIDGNYHTLELPARVPNNAKFVTLRGTLRADSSGKYINFKQYNNVNNVNTQFMYTQGANVTKDLPFPDIPVKDHKIEYRVFSTGVTWAIIELTVIAWKV